MGWLTLANVLTTLVVSSVGTIAMFAVTAFTKLGDGFFKHALDRRMEVFKHDLGREIEQLRARLVRLGDRSTRSNEREYSAIVAAWEGYVESFLATNRCIARFDQYPDLNRMTEPQFREWATGQQVHADDIEAIWQAPDHNRMYGRFLQRKAIDEATRTTFAARLSVRKQGIFMPRDLEVRFMNGINELSEVHAAQIADFEDRSTRMSTAATSNFLESGSRRYEELKDAARARLMYEESTAPRAQK